MLIFPSLAVCSFLVVVSGSPIDDNVPLIANYPYVASIELDNRYIGGASILNRHFVLTFGLIVLGNRMNHLIMEGSSLSVRAGSDFSKKNGTVHRVCDYMIKNSSLVALLQLADPIEFDRLRQPIRLFGPSDKVEPGTKVSLSAWSNLNSASVDSPKLEIFEVVVKDDCSKRLYKVGVFCIDTPKDIYGMVGLGHPVVIDGMQAGIVMVSYNGNTEVRDITVNFNWITETMKRMAKDRRQNVNNKCH